ncbi:MAG: glycoside hydrolase family 3 C-terminal domain-containing protein [Pontiellaceae bacterium]|nr:glycoside hydrolase family 3 C-terminal domain-containing protein [Pontiellaceae bacterium]
MKRMGRMGLLAAIAAFCVVQVQAEEFPFNDPALSMEDRIEDLISRMTVEEKIEQLRYAAPAIERLDIPSYNWWNECLHGVARNGRATVFPQAIGMAATFDEDLIKRIGAAIAVEARAKYNACSAQDYRERYQGLTFWTPNINIFRDPRWGRGMETYGEDPFLTSLLGVSFVEGLQGDNPDYLMAAGCAKHYAVHSGPEDVRHSFDAEVTAKDLWETYLPAFEALVVDGKVEGIMGAYNRVNGDPACASEYLIQDVLRDQWGFEGYFTSDCGAIEDFYVGHGIVDTAEEAAAMALKAGCNLECGDVYKVLPQALAQGLITEEDLDRNLRELLPTRFRLGLFDPSEMVPFSSITSEVIGCDEHRELSREAAVKSLVLLKNDNVLPMRKDYKKVYVTGPTATQIDVLLGNYFGVNENLTTILAGITGRVSPHTTVEYRPGSLMDRPNANPMDWFSNPATESEVTVACLGIYPLMEGEEGGAIASSTKGDRMDLNLPENQLTFLRTIREKADKLVVVITGGSPSTCEEVIELADAVIWVWYPGQEGGLAVADVLFGDAVPSGRLPITFPKSLDDLPLFEDYSMEGRTYRYMTKEPLFPFGFGLSYTQFKYSNLRLNTESVEAGKSTVMATVTVSNTGSVAAEEVVQLYLTVENAPKPAPLYSLRGVQRIKLNPGERKTVQFEITPEMMSVVDAEGKQGMVEGPIKVIIGGCSPVECAVDLGAPQPVTASFIVE